MAAWVRQVVHLVAHRAALRPYQHRVLEDRVVPNKLVAQVVPAHRVADPAVLRAVAPAVLVDKAAQVDWPWAQLAATPKCEVVSQPEPGRRHRDLLVSAVAHSRAPKAWPQCRFCPGRPPSVDAWRFGAAQL